MIGPPRVWLTVALLFAVGNLAGAGFAIARGELPHAATHVALFLVGAFVAAQITSRRRVAAEIATAPREITDRLTLIEQSVDAVAIEVERLGEGQRFITRLFTEHGARQAPVQGAAAPAVETKAQE